MSKDDYEYIKVEIKNLLLDDRNYRFPFSMTDRSQDAIIKYLLNSEDAKRIVTSINSYGYLPNNALYIVKSMEQSDKYIVKEGNRRCASVKALLNPAKYGLKYPKIAMKDIDCYLFDNPKLLDDLILSRHTQSEIKSWHRLQQARYVKDMVDNGTKLEDIKISQANVLYKLALFCEKLITNNKNIVNFIEMNNVSTVFERLFAKELDSVVPFSFDANNIIVKDDNEFDVFVKGFYKLVENKKADTRSLANAEMTRKFLFDNGLIKNIVSTSLSEKKENKQNKDETKRFSSKDNNIKEDNSSQSPAKKILPKEQIKLFQNINFSSLMIKYPSFCELSQELQKLNFKKQPYSAFILLRTFVEGAIKIYLKGISEFILNHKNKQSILSSFPCLLKDIEIIETDGLDLAVKKLKSLINLKSGKDYFIDISAEVRDYFNNAEIDNFRKEANKIIHKNCYPAIPEMVKRYGNPIEDKIGFLLFTEDFKINEIFLK